MVICKCSNNILNMQLQTYAQVGVFFPMILLKPFDPQALQAGAAGGGAGGGSSSSTSTQYRMVVLRCLRELVSDGQLLVDLFVNYDCDLESSNLFERLVNGLVKLAQLPVSVSAGQCLTGCTARPIKPRSEQRLHGSQQSKGWEER